MDFVSDQVIVVYQQVADVLKCGCFVFFDINSVLTRLVPETAYKVYPYLGNTSSRRKLDGDSH